jgi:hypothetical protein
MFLVSMFLVPMFWVPMVLVYAGGSAGTISSCTIESCTRHGNVDRAGSIGAGMAPLRAVRLAPIVLRACPQDCFARCKRPQSVLLSLSQPLQGAYAP